MMAKTKGKIIAGIILLALVILPTGTPEDLLVTIPLIAYIGTQAYLRLALFVVAMLLIYGVTWDDVKRTVGGIKW
jgi:hypothetical protein